MRKINLKEPLMNFRFRLLLLAVILCHGPSALAQSSELWICSNPQEGSPLIARSPDEKAAQTPPCIDWMQVRANSGFSTMLINLAGSIYPAANTFADKVFNYMNLEYPQTSLGQPVMTSDIYTAPERYDFSSVSIEDAEPGSLVVYDGLAGVLVEARPEGEDDWTKRVIYPSAAGGFNLKIANPEIPGKQTPFAVMPQ